MSEILNSIAKLEQQSKKQSEHIQMSADSVLKELKEHSLERISENANTTARDIIKHNKKTQALIQKASKHQTLLMNKSEELLNKELNKMTLGLTIGFILGAILSAALILVILYPQKIF